MVCPSLRNSQKDSKRRTFYFQRLLNWTINALLEHVKSGHKSLDCITMSAPLDAIRVLLIGFGKKEPEFGSYAGQLDTGHGVR